MTKSILLFAVARERAGVPALSVELPPNPTILDLKSALARACPALRPLLPTIRIAVDSEYALDDGQLIASSSELAAIPPVSGGSNRTHASP